jgi:putative ABC transport system ATP-binding protein
VNEEVLLQLDGISMHYAKGETAVTALAGVDLTVHAGELIAVMGASGSGKSTMLTIAGAIETNVCNSTLITNRPIAVSPAAGRSLPY